MAKKEKSSGIDIKKVFFLQWTSLASTAINFFLAEFVWENDENLFIHLILTIILCVLPFILIWLDGVPKESKIITSLSFSILMLSPIVLPHKIELLVDFAISIFIIISMIYCLKTKKTCNILIWIFELVYILGVFVLHFTGYVYVNTVVFPMWQIVVSVGLFHCVLYIVADFRKNKPSLSSIFAGIIFSFLAALLVGVIFAHLNYALDFSEPQRIEVIIVEKEYEPRSGRRYSTPKYKFRFDLNGKKSSLWVSSFEYDKYEEGDLYVLDLYNGALGEPFLIPGKYRD